MSFEAAVSIARSSSRRRATGSSSITRRAGAARFFLFFRGLSSSSESSSYRRVGALRARLNCLSAARPTVAASPSSNLTSKVSPAAAWPVTTAG